MQKSLLTTLHFSISIELARQGYNIRFSLILLAILVYSCLQENKISVANQKVDGSVRQMHCKT